MTEFNIGDRVQVAERAWYTALMSGRRRSKVEGKVGTVAMQGLDQDGDLRIKADGDDYHYWVAPEYVTLLSDIQDSEPQDTPEAGVWLVYDINGTSDVGVVFEQEIDALREANKIGARAKWAPFGTEFTLY